MKRLIFFIRDYSGSMQGAPTEVVSTQHLDETWDSAKVRKVIEPYIHEALDGNLPIANDCNWYINPTGK